MQRPVDFFLGANAPDGFFSLFDELTHPAPGVRRFLLKGGPGCGKSGLMRRIAAELAPAESHMEYIHCASDPDSLDGVLFDDGKMSVVDATPPHAIEPGIPGGFESIVNLGEAFDEELLAKRVGEIAVIQSACAARHQSCRNLLRGAAMLQRENAQILAPYVEKEKIRRVAASILRREIPDVPGNPVWRRRFLSAVTPQGIVCFEQTVRALCDRVYLLEDEYGVAAPLFLSALADALQRQNVLCYRCDCTLFPGERMEHLLLPGLSLGFVTASRRHPFSSLTPYRVIHAARFLDPAGMRAHRQSLRFRRKTAEALLDAAVGSMREAKAIHDQIEAYYHDAVDFSRVDAIGAALLDRMQRRISAR